MCPNNRVALDDLRRLPGCLMSFMCPAMINVPEIIMAAEIIRVALIDEIRPLA